MFLIFGMWFWWRWWVFVRDHMPTALYPSLALTSLSDCFSYLAETVSLLSSYVPPWSWQQHFLDTLSHAHTHLTLICFITHTFVIHANTHVPCVPVYSIIYWSCENSTLFCFLEMQFYWSVEWKNSLLYQSTTPQWEHITYAFFNQTNHIVQMMSRKFNVKTNTFDINTYIRYYKIHFLSVFLHVWQLLRFTISKLVV